MNAYTYPEAHAPRGLGALSVLCVYAEANEGGVRLALLQGHTVVFRGEGFYYQVLVQFSGRQPAVGRLLALRGHVGGVTAYQQLGRARDGKLP